MSITDQPITDLLGGFHITGVGSGVAELRCASAGCGWTYVLGHAPTLRWIISRAHWHADIKHRTRPSHQKDDHA